MKIVKLENKKFGKLKVIKFEYAKNNKKYCNIKNNMLLYSCQLRK